MLNKYKNYAFQSSSGVTPEFKTFSTSFKREIKKAFKDIAGEIVFNVNHFEISGFVRLQNDVVVYFNTCDVRDPKWYSHILYRKARDFKDYTGEQNRYTSLDKLPTTILDSFGE